MRNKTLHLAAHLLIIIGGLNWLLIGLFNWGIENAIGSALSRTLYIIIGLAAVYELIMHIHHCKTCSKTQPKPPASPHDHHE